MSKSDQRAFCCPCGRTDILALGLCGTCYSLKRQDEEYFGGLREDVLRRDNYRCRVCHGLDPGVHHRVPGVSKLHLMLALCAGCHARVHRTKMMITKEYVRPLLLELWREQHPNAAEQTVLDFQLEPQLYVSAPLFVDGHEKAYSRNDHVSTGDGFSLEAGEITRESVTGIVR